MGRFFLGCIFKSAYDFIDFLADCGFKYWQVLPFCLPDEYNSPYKSYSAFSVNPYFIDIERLYDRELITRQELRDAKQKSPNACEFNRLAYERLPLLKKASTRFLETKRLEDFYALHPQAAKFCEFMALRYANGDKPWYEWTELTPNKDELHA
ncbi:MAG: 4-alpha-glucanotransferase [Clostridia bacterium]|nr:4-alpha-glucanotransferase [Clostridia bacterium]